MALRNLLLMTKEMRSLLQKKGGMAFMQSQPKSNLTPTAGWFGDLFKVETILKYWEIIPIIVSGAVSVALPILHLGFMCYKSNELRFWPGRRMLVEKHQYIIDGAPPPCHKYMVINQKYEWPCGLLKALKDDADCSDNDKAKKVSFKFWKRENNSDKTHDE